LSLTLIAETATILSTAQHLLKSAVIVAFWMFRKASLKAKRGTAQVFLETTSLRFLSAAMLERAVPPPQIVQPQKYSAEPHVNVGTVSRSGAPKKMARNAAGENAAKEGSGAG
jgi:hypothetical protein